MISKPIVPPWDDSAKNIVHNQLAHSKRFRYRVLGTASSEPPAPGVTVDPIYPDAGAYSPGLKQNLRVMLHGLRPRGADLYHYFFAPNPVSSLAGRAQRLVARVKSVQTVCSKPRSFAGIGRLLFSDKVVVLSRDSAQQMIRAGVEPGRVVHLRPGIDPLDAPGEAEKRAVRRGLGIPETSKVVLFPGDYEFSDAARTVAGAVPFMARSHPDLTVVFACRIKREPSRAIRDELRAQLERGGHAARVIFLDRVDDMPALAGSVDVVVLPAESLYAKMDVPLVLLEAMSQGVPIVVASVPPINELLEFGCGIGVPPSSPEALAEAVARLVDNPDEASCLGGHGAGAVREVFSAAAMAKAMEQIYEEVLAK